MFRGAEYGLWDLVILHSLIFIIFGFSFFRPRTGRDWRTFGAFSAFLVALFTEMYGFPLTIYLLSGWLANRFPEVDWLAHNSGHLLQTMLGWQGNPHFGPLHIISDMLVLGGLILLASAWKVLYRAQRNHEIARSGPYAKIRHPQYTAFIIIMIGFLLQWPTLPTLLMFPILALLYIRLARREEKEALKRFGDQYTRYVQNTPGFIPRIQLNAAT
jgi:protein-S-isoprenylcysteine O-methyltransferase Ste14